MDLRNHGRSAEIEGISPPHDMANAAKDVADLVNTQGWAWPDVVLGHSLGGKVAMQFAESCARGDYGESAQLPKQVFLYQIMSCYDIANLGLLVTVLKGYCHNSHSNS